MYTMNSTRGRDDGTPGIGQCKYCVVHQYGVFLVDTAWLIIMLFTAIVYRYELYACLSGRIRRAEPLYYADSRVQLANDYLDKRRPDEPGAFKAALGPKPEIGLKKSIPAELHQETRKAHESELKEKQVAPKNATSPTKQSVSPQAAIVDMNVTRTENKTDTTTTKGQSPRLDQFKLPTVKRAESPGNIAHQSTGSDYFNQMMRGKKPVASISQYLQLKKQQNVKETNVHNHRAKKATPKDKLKKPRKKFRKDKK